MADNVDIARRAPLARGEELRALLHPDVELDMSEIPDGQVYRGADAFLGYLDAHGEAWESHEIEILDAVAAGDRVVITLRERGAGAASGVPVETVVADVFTIEDGLITHCRLYNDVDEAHRAAGVAAGRAGG